jgi:hypothetical protein
VQPFCLLFVPAALRLGYFCLEIAIELACREPIAITGDGGVLEPQIDPNFRRLWRRGLVGNRHGQAQIPVPD